MFLNEQKLKIHILYFYNYFIIDLYLFFYILRKIVGISAQYHPDSVYYFENFSRYTNLSFKLGLFENIKIFYEKFFSNALYPSIINLIFEFVKKLFRLNLLIFFIILCIDT